jgi:peroxiredoxin Q/BCP
MMKTVLVGDKVPHFTLKSLTGQLFEINEIIGVKQLVLIFFPSDGSYGCKNVSCSYHDITEYFDSRNFAVFGICGQPAEKLKHNSKIQELKFPVVSDHNNEIRRLFGLSPLRLGQYNMLFTKGFGLNTGRLTFVTNRQGEVIYRTESQDGLKCHADEALKILFLLGNTMRRSSLIRGG